MSFTQSTKTAWCHFLFRHGNSPKAMQKYPRRNYPSWIKYLVLYNVTSSATLQALNFHYQTPYTVCPQNPGQLRHNARPSAEYLNGQYILCPKSQLQHPYCTFLISFPQRNIILIPDCRHFTSFLWCMMLLLNSFNQAIAILPWLESIHKRTDLFQCSAVLPFLYTSHCIPVCILKLLEDVT